jgi:type I restriction enzyme S subunit
VEAKDHFTSTAGQARVPTSFIEDLEIPIAPLAEQRRIAAKLQELIVKVDASRARLDQVQRVLERFRQSVLAAACSGRLTADWRDENGQVEEWPVHKLSALGQVSGGITKNAGRGKMPLQVPYLRVANVYGLELNEVLEIGVTEQEYERTRLQNMDLLFVEGNGSLDQIGRVALWDGTIPRCVHQNHLIKFRAGRHVLPAYVLLQMMGPDGRSQLVEKSTSSAGLNTLSISKIADVDIPVPSGLEQQEVVRRVNRLFKFSDRVEKRLTDVQAVVERITPSLLAKAFRGELVATEAELALRDGRQYESASELLLRIQGQRRAATETENRRSRIRSKSLGNGRQRKVG